MKKFDDIVAEMLEIYEHKNADYGNSFEQTCDEFGIVAALVRMNDKMQRIKKLGMFKQLNGEVADESIIDTLTDLANYAIMTRLWLENNKKAA